MAFWDGPEMRRILRSGGEVFAIEDGLAPSSSGVALDLPDLLSAIGFVRRLLDDPHCADTLRDLLTDDLSGPALDEQDVVEAVAHRIESRRLRVVRLPAEALVGLGAAPAEEEVPAPEARRVKDWVEIVLVDEEDQPVAGADYEITLPDGSTLTGQTGQGGRIRITDIDPGVCRFSFTRLDERAWTPA